MIMISCILEPSLQPWNYPRLHRLQGPQPALIVADKHRMHSFLQSPLLLTQLQLVQPCAGKRECQNSIKNGCLHVACSFHEVNLRRRYISYQFCAISLTHFHLCRHCKGWLASWQLAFQQLFPSDDGEWEVLYTPVGRNICICYPLRVWNTYITCLQPHLHRYSLKYSWRRIPSFNA